MTEAQISQRMQEMDAIVRKASARFHKGPAIGFGDGGQDGESRPRVPVEYGNPLDELCAREDAAERDAAFAAIEMLLAEGAELPLMFQEKVQEAARAAAIDQFRQYEETFMEWLFSAGPHPLEVLRRLFGYVKMKRASLLWNMGFRDVGPLLGETHAAAALRCKLLFGETPAGWKKKLQARLKMQEAALGNCNRRGGKKVKRAMEAINGKPHRNGVNGHRGGGARDKWRQENGRAAHH